VNRTEHVDVVIPTYNSNKAHFGDVIRAVRSEVPVHHLIVVDRYSQDGTVETVKEIFPEATIIQSESRLSQALREAFSHIDTELFVFIDDDIQLGQSWFYNIRKCMDLKGVGAAYSLAIARRNGGFEADNLHLFGAVIRTSLIQDWTAPDWLSVGANILLGRHIRSKGFRIIATSDAKTTSHDPTPGFSIKVAPYYYKKGRWEGSGERVIGFSIREILIGGFLTMGSNIARRRMRAHFGLLASTSFFAGQVVGYFSWRKYHDWHRPPAL